MSNWPIYPEIIIKKFVVVEPDLKEITKMQIQTKVRLDSRIGYHLIPVGQYSILYHPTDEFEAFRAFTREVYKVQHLYLVTGTLRSVDGHLIEEKDSNQGSEKERVFTTYIPFPKHG